MSKNESTLPGELNENWGSNYMLDGFWHDMEYEHGLKENPAANPVPQPAESGMAQLPDGLMVALEIDDSSEPEFVIQHQEDDGAMDLAALGIVAKLAPDVDRSDVGIADHTWLSDAYQDPSRLPDKPVDNGIPELQEAWGDRTDGITRVDLYDRSSLTYEDAMQHEEDDDPLNRDKLASFVRMAMRRSAAGQSMGLIKQKLLDAMGPKLARQIAKPVQAIQSEHGLSGNVYVRASAYPRLQHGKWAAELKKASKGCRYLIAAEGEDCQSCATALSLQVVAHPNEIPWADELQKYAVNLRATRKEPKKASKQGPREYLQMWLLGASQSPRLDIEPSRNRHTMPVDTVTAAEAEKALVEFKVPHRVVLDMTERHNKKDAEKVVKRVGAMVKAHLVTPEEAQSLLTSNAPPKDILKAAAKIALTVKKATYQGAAPAVRGETISKEAAWGELNKAAAKWEAGHQVVRDRVAKEKIEQKVRLIKAKINGGLKGKRLASFIRETLTQQEAFLASPLLKDILKKTSALNPKAAAVKQYDDATFTRHVASSPEIAVPAKEIRKAARWVRQQMTEGMAGAQLDQLVQLRLDHKVRKAGEQQIAEIRNQHEGVSGHLYVEAAAYASAEGTAGCEKGSLRHRANELKFVLAMERCGSCVFKNANSTCQKYNKELIDELSPEIKNEFQSLNLASHAMTDQESTAAMFAVGENAMASAHEFGLHNAALDDVATEAPDPEMLDGIFFGGGIEI
jgi:hypothetical protein